MKSWLTILARLAVCGVGVVDRQMGTPPPPKGVRIRLLDPSRDLRKILGKISDPPLTLPFGFSLLEHRVVPGSKGKKRAFWNRPLAMRGTPQDAHLLEQVFWPRFKRNELVNFPNHRAAIKMMEDGAPQTPFSMTTVLLKQQSLFEGHREKIIRVSRERNARERVRVEEKINR